MTFRAAAAACLVLAAFPVLAQPSPPARAMSRAEAAKVLDEAGIDPLPDNFPTAILNGDARSVDALIAMGVDPNAKGSLPQAPLELASMSCSNPRTRPDATVHMVDALAAAGADPNSPGMQGLGPLMIASQQCGAEVVRHLLAAGARIDSRTPQGFTPLSMALITRHYDAAGVLIDAGARLPPDAARKLTDGSDDAALKALVARATGGS